MATGFERLRSGEPAAKPKPAPVRKKPPTIVPAAAKNQEPGKSGFSRFLGAAGGIAKEVVLAPLRALATPFGYTYKGVRQIATGEAVEHVNVPVLGDIGVSNDPVKAAGQMATRSLDIGLAALGGGTVTSVGKETIKQGFKAGVKKAFVSAIKNAPKDFAIGSTYGLASGLAEGEDAEGLLKSSAEGGLVGVLLPPVVGSALGVASKGLRAGGRFVAGQVNKAATALERSAERTSVKTPEALKEMFYGGVTADAAAQKSPRQNLAEKGAKAIRFAQKNADNARTWLIDKFTPVTRLQRKMEELGLNPADLTEEVQAAEYRGLGRAENRLDEYNALRLSYGEDWAHVKQLALYLDHADRIAAGDVLPGQMDMKKVRDDLRTLAEYLGPERFAEVEKGQRRLQEFLDQELRGAVESGRITAENYEAIKKVHPNYIPHRIIDELDEGANVGAGGSMQLTTSGIEKTEGGSSKKIDDVDASIVRLLVKQNRLNSVNRANQTVFAALGDKAETLGFKPLRTAKNVRQREAYAESLSDIRSAVKAKMAVVKSAKGIDKSLVERLEKIELEGERLEDKFYSDLAATGAGTADEEVIRLRTQTERDRRARADFVREFSFGNGAMEESYGKFRDLARRRPWMLDAEIEQIRGRLKKAGMAADRVDDLFYGAEGMTDADALEMFRIRFNTERNAPKPDRRFLARMERIERAVEKGAAKIQGLVDERGELTGDKAAMGSAVDYLERQLDELREFEKDLLVDMSNYLDVKVKNKDAKDSGFETYRFFRDGVREEWLVPKDIGVALKALDRKEQGMLYDFLDYTIGNIARFKRGIATQWNPMFSVVSNPIRDVQTAQVTSGLALTIADFAKGRNLAKSAKEGVNADSLLKLAREAGALQGGIMREAQNPEKILAAKARISKLDRGSVTSRLLKPFSSAFEWVQAAGQLQEETTRMAVFVRALKSGMSPTQAAKVARQSTVDFGRGGSAVQVANKYVPFLNARIQGAANLVKAIERDPIGTTRKLMVSALWPTVGLTAWNTRFESYQNVPDDVKQKYWVLMVNEVDGTDLEGKPVKVPYYIKVPKGEGQQAVSAMTERFLTLANEKYPRTTHEFLFQLMEDVSPVTDASVGPAGITEAWELKTNYSLFRDKQIVPDWVRVNGKWYKSDDVKPRRQRQDNTSEVAAALGNVLNWSPIKIDYVIKQGLVGDLLRAFDVAVDAADGDVERMKGLTGFQKFSELPWLRSFIGSASYGQSFRKKEYEKKLRIEKNEEKFQE